MRTTLTLDDDVAMRLEEVMKKRQKSLKAAVNEALRLGLEALDKSRSSPRRFRTKGFDLGPSLVGSLDNIEEALSRAEGEDHR
jgi:hypothetical protein